MGVSLYLPEWISWLCLPKLLLSVAAGNREGRLSAETLEAVEEYTLLRTDRNGWIELTTDREQMWVQVECKEILACGDDARFRRVDR